MSAPQVTCWYCRRPARLVTGMDLYPHRPDLFGKRFWRCLPCAAWVGCHPDTTEPLGRLANSELRSLKQAVHRVLDLLWQQGGMSREEAYAWLAEQLELTAEECHVGMFDPATCRRAIEALNHREVRK